MTGAGHEAEAEVVPARRLAWWLLRREPLAYTVGWVVWVAFHALPIPAGLLLKAVLDHVQDDTNVVWVALAALAGVELGRWLLVVFASVQWHGCWVFW